MSGSGAPNTNLDQALRGTLPDFERLVEAAEGRPLYLVGGAVRDLLLGIERSDLDLVIEGDGAGLASKLGGEVIAHERFSTAKLELGGIELDIASARSETYPAPGALPEVELNATITDDLGRRDFTINAMALSLREPTELVDPYGGQADLEAGLLRVLHPRSFVDDPTRALRAARYAARFGFELETGTEALLSEAKLSTVSADRRRAELERIAAEPEALRGFALAEGWGVVDLRPRGIDHLAAVAVVISRAPWNQVAERRRVLYAAAIGPAGREGEFAAARPKRPSEAVELARGATPEELVLARALGAAWLDDYIAKWRSVVLEIGGEDLIAAGIPEGPAVGAGLAAALRAKLDGEISGREAELELAVAEARRALG
jgi:tRNA nucleotidyltransferase (CCA-adding enzyme)